VSGWGQSPSRQVEHTNYQSNRQNPMSYMQELEARLQQLLAGIPEGEQAIIIREMKEFALESYHNGQAAGPRPQSGRPEKAPPQRKQ
jgi:hypothetical protein